MPTIEKIASFKFTIENFLDACSPKELKEVDLLIQSNRYRQKMKGKRQLKAEAAQEERDEIEALGFDPDFFLGESKHN